LQRKDGNEIRFTATFLERNVRYRRHIELDSASLAQVSRSRGQKELIVQKSSDSRARQANDSKHPPEQKEFARVESTADRSRTDMRTNSFDASARIIGGNRMAPAGRRGYL